MNSVSDFGIYILMAVHFLMMFLWMSIILFSDNIKILWIVGLVLFGILFVNYRCGDCPISIIEERYVGDSMVDIAQRKIDPRHTRQHRPLVTKQVLWISLLLVTTKILYVLLKRTLRSKRLFR